MLPARLITLVTFLLDLSNSSPVYNLQSAFITTNIGSSSGRNIRNLPCVSRKNKGLRGVCMFAIDCLKMNGTHLGTCIDRFYFGSCCHMEPIKEIGIETNIILDSREPPERLRNTTVALSTTTHSSFSSLSTSKITPTPSTLSTTSTKGTTTEASTTAQKLQTFQEVETTTLRATTLAQKLSSTTIRPSSSTTKSTTTKRLPTTTKPTRRATRPPTTTTTVKTKRPSVSSTKKPSLPASLSTTTKRPLISSTKKPSSSAVTSTKRPLVSSTRKPPSSSTTSTKRPAGSSTASTIKRPLVSSTRKPPSSSAASTKRPSGSTASTTKRPSSSSTASTTKRPLGSSTASTTKRPLVSSTTKPPTTAAPPATTTKRPLVSSTKKPSSASSTVSTTTKGPSSTVASTPSILSTWLQVNSSTSTTALFEDQKNEVVESTSTTKPEGSSTTLSAEFTSFSSTSTTMKSVTNSTQAPSMTTSGWVLLPSVVTTPPPPSNASVSLPPTPPSTTSTGEATQGPGGGGSNSTTMETTTIVVSSTETVNEDKPVNMSDFTDVCGRRMWPEARIVGGEKSAFGRWPWQISLRQWRTSTYLHKCGAALLNENWAITAAHCVDNVPPSDLLLRLGEHDLSTEGEPYLHEERRVQIVASHPQFDPRTFEYDLALLRFYEPVQFQPNIVPVCVPKNDENFVGRTAHVTGWGRLYEDGPLPSVLQEVTVPVINNSVCESMYRTAGYIEHIPHIFICAGWRKGGFDSCEGDSGGPMVIQRDDKRFLLAGVISWGIGCAEPNQPGVYTRISEFRDWINQILQF